MTREAAILVVGLDRTGRGLASAVRRARPRVEVIALDGDAVSAPDLASALARAGLVFVTARAPLASSVLRRIGPGLGAGALVTTTCSPMGPVLEAAADLPARVGFIAGHPVLPAAAAAPDDRLLEGVEYCLAPAPATAADSVRWMADLVEAMGARPYFIDPVEHDVLAPAVDHLPRIAVSELVRVLGESPSVVDLRRLAGGGPAVRGWPVPVPDAPADAPWGSERETAAWIGVLMAGLAEWREALETGDADRVAELVARGRAARAAWDEAEDREA